MAKHIGTRATAETLAKHYWVSKVYGTRMNLTPNEIDDDGRSQKKTIASLLHIGLIVAIPGGPDDGESVVCQPAENFSKGFDAVKPDIVGMVGVNEVTSLHALDSIYGALTIDLTTANLRYIAEHSENYTFVDQWNSVLTEKPYFSKAHFVRDSEFGKAIEERRLALQLEDSTNRNLAWGLVEAGILTTDEGPKSLFTCDGPSSPFRGTGFGLDPDKWEEDIAIMIDSREAKVKSLTADIDILRAVNKEIIKKGGWANFLADYKIRIAEAVRTQKDETK